MAVLLQNSIQAGQGRLDELLPSSNSHCSRCHGLLVKTFCIAPEEGIVDFQIEVMKCLQCGNLFDNTILENRWRSQHHQLIHYKGARKQ